MNLLLSLLTGALLVLVFPRFEITCLAPVALAPLLVASSRESNWKRRFCNGWASGFVFWFFICIWIQFVLEVHGGMGRWGGWGTFVLFAILKALHTGLFAALARPLMRSSFALVGTAALWCAIEYAHGTWGLAWLGLGFAWLDLGNAGIDWPVLLRMAPIFGVHGLSFVFAMTGCAVALLALRGAKAELLPLLVLPGLLLLPALPQPVAGKELVQVVQPDVDTEARWTEESFAAFEARLRTLSLDEQAPLIVWPEAPAPFYPSRPAFFKYLAGIAQDSHASFLMGGVAYATNDAPLNSAFLFDASGKLIDRYDKIQLVPFGEYIPPAFSWVNRITGEAGDFQPGTRIATLPVGEHRIGTFICYESAFPNLVRQFAAQGGQLLVNISNDGYFGDSAAREQHLSLVRMRAAENGRWILRATNDGITAMVDPAGRIAETIPPHNETSEIMRFNYVSAMTGYTEFGDWFPWLCTAVAIGLLLYCRKPGTTA